VIKSAVVPVAGLGTRLLPATKSQPKEMLPVARKPIVQYVVEELVSNGIQQILFVTGRGKSTIENHFDHDPELARALTAANKQDLLKELDFEALKANFFYTRQRFQKGLGDAICALRTLPARSLSWWLWAIPFWACTRCRAPSPAWRTSSSPSAPVA